MANRKKSQPFNIPKNILNSIEECSNHGYILFTFDDKDDFRIYCNFQNAIAATSFYTQVGNYIDAVRGMQQQATIESMFGGHGGGQKH